MNIFREWPHNWFGFWRFPDELNALPLMEELVDPQWKSPEKHRLIAYLEQAPIAVVSDSSAVACKLCGVTIGNPSCYKSDNVWLWPCDLAHFVEVHDVRLPDRMVQDIAARQYAPPTVITIRSQQLPWPALSARVNV